MSLPYKSPCHNPFWRQLALQVERILTIVPLLLLLLLLVRVLLPLLLVVASVGCWLLYVVCVTDIALSLACTRNVKTWSPSRRPAWVSSALAFAFALPFCSPPTAPLGCYPFFGASSDHSDRRAAINAQKTPARNGGPAGAAAATEFLYRSKVVLKFN